jgi:predicted ATP-binding protein involved in virulence
VRQALVGVNGMLNDAEQRRFTDMKVTYQESPKGNFVFIKKGVKLLETQLSSGERSLMTLVADIARRLVIANPLSKNPLLEGSGLVLIDEIDLHLHPLWQRKVVGKLMELFPNVQFVVTTHSPSIVANCKTEQINLIKFDAELQKKVAVHPKYSEGHSIEYILSQLMDTSTHNPIIDDYLSLMRLGLLNSKQGKKLQKVIDNLDPNSPEKIRINFALQRLKSVGK